MNNIFIFDKLKLYMKVTFSVNPWFMVLNTHTKSNSLIFTVKYSFKSEP